MTVAAFQVTASSLDPFVFRLPGERKDRELPHLGSLPIGIKGDLARASAPMMKAIKAGRKPTDAAELAAGEAMLSLFDRVAPGLTNLIDERQLAQLMAAWEEHSGVSLGES